MPTDKNLTLKNIKEILSQIRPSLQADGGDVELVEFVAASGTLQLKLTGACSHCPMSQITLQRGIGDLIKEKIPQVKKVEAV